MAVTPDDLLEPTGRIDAAWFSEDQHALLTRLDGYVSDGVAKVTGLTHLTAQADQDRAVRAWAYARAFRYLHLTLQRTPQQMGVDGEGSRAFSDAQLSAWKREEQTALGEYQDLATPAAGVRAQGSRSTPTGYVW